MSEIKRYSEVSQSHSILIDNYNPDTDSLVFIDRVELIPFFRVCKRSRQNNFFHEKFFLDELSANKYFSQLMGEKLELF